MRLTQVDRSVLMTAIAVLGLGCSENGADPSQGVTRSNEDLGTSQSRSALLAGTGVGAAPSGALDGAPTTSSEYKFAPTLDPDVQPNVVTELWARVYRPTILVPGLRYPLLVFLHGNHRTCGHGSNPRIDDSYEYTSEGKCPDGKVVVPNHEGYAYVADQLASQGYIVVSINANRGITMGDGVPGDECFILARANLVLKHLEKLSRWDRGIETTPSTLGVSLANHLDFSQVGLMGHSRGGEGVRLAFNRYTAPGSPWPARILSPVKFAGIFEIGPVDSYYTPAGEIPNTRWAVILPMCDGDMSNLDGVKPFDRVMSVLDETPPGFKSTLTVWGTNHNYYNSEWQRSDSFGCVGHTALFSSGPGISGSAAQREVGRIAMSSFFRGNIGAQRDPSLNALFDPANSLPSSLTSITRVDRGFTLSPDKDITLRLEDFNNPTGTSTFGQPNQDSGITIAHTTVWEHDDALQVGKIKWETPGNGTFFQTNFAPSGSGISLVGYETLDMRIDRASDSLNPEDAPTDFTVQLESADGALSAPQQIASYLSLTGPVGGPGGLHSMLQTARIPLSSFAPTTLGSIRGVRLTFNKTGSGVIYVGNIRATRATCGATPRLDLKVREVVRRANEIQFRVQIFNRGADPIRLSDISTKLWISEPTTSLVAQVYYGGGVYDGAGNYKFGGVTVTASTKHILPACVPTPDRAADWAATLSSTDSRSIPGNGGVWTDAIINVHRADWANFFLLTDDFSQTPAYQGGVVSDATWPTVFGDDTHFVVYDKGTPVSEYSGASTPDPVAGKEPSCLVSCIESVTNGLAPSYLASTLLASEAVPPAPPLASRNAMPMPSELSQAKVARLAPTTRELVPGGVDLEVVSDTPFPSGDAAPLLFAGDMKILLSRHTLADDDHSLTFTFTAEQFAQLAGGETLSIRYSSRSGGPRWEIGPLDKTQFGK